MRCADRHAPHPLGRTCYDDVHTAHTTSEKGSNMSRKYRTPAQVLADAQATAKRIEKQEQAKAVNLLDKADGWEKRSEELKAKAEGARAQAEAALEAIGLDPAGFIAEYYDGKKEG